MNRWKVGGNSIHAHQDCTLRGAIVGYLDSALPVWRWVAFAVIVWIVMLSAVAFGQTVSVIIGADTARVTTVSDTTITPVAFGDPIVRIETRIVPDTLTIEVAPGDTLDVKTYAHDWPECVGYFASIEHVSDILLPDDPRPDQFPLRVTDYAVGSAFWNVSALPTSVSGLVKIDDRSFQAGFQSLGDSRGGGDGILGYMPVAVVLRERATFTVAAVDIVTLDETLSFVTTRVPVGIHVILNPAPEPERITADHNGNGVVDFNDFLAFAERFATVRDRDVRFDDRFDYDQTGDIGFTDFLMFAADFGKPPRVYWTREVGR